MAGCQPAPTAQPTLPIQREITPLYIPAVTPLTSPSPAPANTPTSLPGPTATSVLATAEGGHELGLSPLAAASPAPDPLRLVFPTPGRPPVSAWRPALYPVPWAPTEYDHFYFARPIAADEINWPVWDYRYGGAFFENVVHTGIDIPTPNGTPVLAAGSGKVVWAGYGLYRGIEDKTDPFGLAVAIRHDFGYGSQALFTAYGHLQQVDVVRGQHLETGQQIGLSGETGKVTGPHLHFEVRVGENDYFATRNPELWLSPPQGWGIIAGRVMNSAGILKPEQNVIISAKSSSQNWFARSYGLTSINSDPYYQENLVISDLPAGIYEIRIPYLGIEYQVEIQVLPGLVSFFYFYGHEGFEIGPPPNPAADFVPYLEQDNLSPNS